MGLKDLIREVHGPSQLIPALDVFIRQKEDDHYRAVGWHPSEFCSMCSRAEVIRNLTTDIVPWKPDVRLQKIFDVGHALHDWYQNKYFGPMGILWGKWKCEICGEIRWGLMPKQGEVCQQEFEVGRKSSSRNRPHWWKYLEVPFRWDMKGLDKPVVGHGDGLIILGKIWSLLEMKSINDRGFNFLPNAKVGHVDQGQVYGDLARRGKVDCPETIIPPRPEKLIVLYIGKNTSQEKEFSMDLDAERAKLRLQQPLLYDTAFREKVLPPRSKANPLCKNLLKVPAKDCDMCSYCFGDLGWEQLASKKRK